MNFSVLPSEIHREIVSFLHPFDQKQLCGLSPDLCSNYYRNVNKVSFSSDVNHQLFIHDLNHELWEHLEYIGPHQVLRILSIVKSCFMFKSWKILEDLCQRYPCEVLSYYFEYHDIEERMPFDELLSIIPKFAESLPRMIVTSIDKNEAMRNLYSILYWDINRDPKSICRSFVWFEPHLNMEIISCFTNASSHERTPTEFKNKIQKLQAKYGKYRSGCVICHSVQDDPYWRPKLY